MAKIKICGIYRDEDAEYINEYRPDYFGMVIDFERSHRNVNAKTAERLRGMIDRTIPAVGVFVNKDMSEIKELLTAGIIDIAQLHGDESGEQIIRLRENTGRPVWKAFKIKGPADFEAAMASPADLVILDNGFGTGRTFNWDIIGKADRNFGLAGGIGIGNIEEAVNRMKPYLLDISSGVETDKKKDKYKIRAAIELARGTEGR